MICPHCGSDNPAGKKFCGDCGAALGNRCPRCGADNLASKKFCGECGASLLQGPKSKVQSPQPVPTSSVIPEHESRARTTSHDGERKTVTALFADIKGSMELLEDLDPEEARRIIDPALQLMMDAVHRYDGYVAQSTGDGIFALFGAPAAHEDHPQRALYAGLRLQEELKQYSDRIRTEGRLPVQARVGVNTGEVVVRTIQTDATHTEYTPIGHSTSLAARMQALAPVGSIATTDHVRKLCEGYFVFKALGPTRIKGVSEPVAVFEVTGLGPLRTRLQRAAGRGLTKFVGRRAELEAMKRAAESAKAGHGQLVAAVGEAGVGKSRLFYEFKAMVQAGCLVLETFSVSHGKASAYLPVIELLHAYFRIVPEDDTRTRREKVGGKVLMLDRALEDALPYLFALLGLVEGDDPLAQVEAQLRRRRTLEAVKRLVLRESVNQPLLVICEDLHWVDSETQALLNLLADSIGTAKILLLVNHRPEYTHRWGSKTYYTQVRLDPLGRESAEEMLAALLPQLPLPAGEGRGEGQELAALTNLIVEQTEGNPFFMEEIVQSLFEAGFLVRDGTTKLVKPLESLRLPPTVQGILASRIDRLPPEQKELLQTLAVLGKEFDLSLVRAVTGRGDDELNRLLGELQLAEFIYEQPAAGEVEYTFKHALTQEVAYHSVLSERRKLLHERAAAAIEALGPARLEDHLMEVAHHYDRSGNAAKAVEYLGCAGGRAAQQAAYHEAVGHLARALELLPQLPESADRDRQELKLGQSLVELFYITKGYGAPEATVAARRVAVLAERSGTLRDRVNSAISRWEIAFISADYVTCNSLADEALDLAVREGSAACLGLAHYTQLATRYHRGDLSGADDHFTTGRAFFDDPGFRRFPGFAVFVLGFAAWAAWQLGRAEVVRDRTAQMMAAADPNNPYELAWAEYMAAYARMWLGEYEGAETLVAKALASAEQHHFPDILAWTRVLLGHIRALRGHPREGATLIQLAASWLRETGYLLSATLWMEVLAEAQAGAGAIDDALAMVEQALQVNPGEGIHRPEAFRLRGTLRLAKGATDLAAADFREAIALARTTGAKAWELRATMSLARLLADQGQRDDARTMLEEIYGWFTEGFDTVDLKEAKALLEELKETGC